MIIAGNNIKTRPGLHLDSRKLKIEELNFTLNVIKKLDISNKCPQKQEIAGI
jgi:hypothetical protein